MIKLEECFFQPIVTQKYGTKTIQLEPVSPKFVPAVLIVRILNYFIFREIFKVIDLMKMDMANFQLKALKPQLLQQSIEFERTKFKQYLETNPGIKLFINIS